MKPEPRNFPSLTAYQRAKGDYLAADFRRRLMRFFASVFCTVAGILAFINWPAYALAVIGVGSPTLILFKTWLDCQRELKRPKQ